MTKIKLCGMMRPEDIQTAAALRPDYIGFVFAKKSRRYVTPEQAEKLKALLPEEIAAVGVFADEEPERVAQLLDAGIIDLAQLHGHEDEAYLAALRKRTDRPLIRAFQIRERKDLEEAEKSTADFLLLDAGAGSGETFDWAWLRDFPRPFFLAGGLSPDNVEGALERVHPYGVDVSSGIETDGRKDPDKMKLFVEKIKTSGRQ